jgi:hypothetical protein
MKKLSDVFVPPLIFSDLRKPVVFHMGRRRSDRPTVTPHSVIDAIALIAPTIQPEGLEDSSRGLSSDTPGSRIGTLRTQ